MYGLRGILFNWLLVRMGDVGNLVNLQGIGHWFIMLFSRLTGFFQQFREYVCPAFSVPGFRLNVQRTGGILFDGLLSILF